MFTKHNFSVIIIRKVESINFQFLKIFMKFETKFLFNKCKIYFDFLLTWNIVGTNSVY